MRVVLDFQACQSGSRFRGVGRGSRALMLAMANTLMSRGHEVICLLSEAFPDGMDTLSEDIERNAPGAKLASFCIPSPCAAGAPENRWRQMAARVLREYAIACLEPEFVHVPALLADGWGDDAVGSVGMLGLHVPTSLTHHDLIPLAMADSYLQDDCFRSYYMQKLEDVRRADLLLAISEYSRQEALAMLELAPEDVVHISSAADQYFIESCRDADEEGLALARLGIKPGFMFYAPGGFDVRKNIDRLIESYARLPQDVRYRHQLVIASMIDGALRDQFYSIGQRLGLAHGELNFTGYLTDRELACIYRASYLYVFPSMHEGFGLPILEAMAAGIPVVASDCSCIPEVVGMDEALFDPYSVDSMSNKILQGLRDEAFRARSVKHGDTWRKNFSWERSGLLAVQALENKFSIIRRGGWRAIRFNNLPSCERLLALARSFSGEVEPLASDVNEFRMCFERNASPLISS